MGFVSPVVFPPRGNARRAPLPLALTTKEESGLARRPNSEKKSFQVGLAGQGSLGDNPPALDDYELVADFLQLGDEMRTQQQGLPLSPEFQEELARAFNRHRVQRRERLVDDQEVGVDEK